MYLRKKKVRKTPFLSKGTKEKEVNFCRWPALIWKKKIPKQIFITENIFNQRI
jgi:hypothetical protein